MKSFSKIFAIALFCVTAPLSLKAQTLSPVDKAGLKPVEGRALVDAETQQLNFLLATATAAANSITPGPDAGAQRRLVDLQLCGEMERFVTNNPASPWTPNLHLWLARRARLRCGYSLAMDHYEAAFTAVESGIAGPVSESIALEASGGLAKLLALTGQLPAFDALEGAATQLLRRRPESSDWGWAHEMRAWVSKHPTDTYKCGLYCLDQLGRMTQSGAFLPKNITETPSSTNGLTAADLVNLGTSQGLRVRAGMLTDPSKLPVPSIIHLRSEHFVIVTEHRGSLYQVIDPVVYGAKWLTPTEIAQEATGCVIISDTVPLGSVSFSSMDSSAAATYRGRCHSPNTPDHNDSGCPPAADGNLPKPYKAGHGGGGVLAEGGNGKPILGIGWADLASSVTSGGLLGPTACGSCGSASGSSAGGTTMLEGNGMPVWRVSDPYLNLWVKDSPLLYIPAYGPPIRLNLAYRSRVSGSAVSGASWHGAEIATGSWSCSWLSFAELASGDATADVMLPAGGWAAFTFPAGSSISDLSYQHNIWLEKLGPSGGITNFLGQQNLWVDSGSGSFPNV